MSKSLDKIKNYKKLILTNLYNDCTVSQQDKFNRIYGSLDSIPDEKIEHAIFLCEKTIEENETR